MWPDRLNTETTRIYCNGIKVNYYLEPLNKTLSYKSYPRMICNIQICPK